LNFILGKLPKKIFCKKINHLSQEWEDYAIITLEYEDFIAHIEASWLHPLKKRDMWIIGSKNQIHADFLEQKLTGTEIEFKEPLKEELIHFISVIENKAPNLGEEKITPIKICEKCLKSAETGKEATF